MTPAAASTAATAAAATLAASATANQNDVAPRSWVVPLVGVPLVELRVFNPL